MAVKFKVKGPDRDVVFSFQEREQGVEVIAEQDGFKYVIMLLSPGERVFRTSNLPDWISIPLDEEGRIEFI
jgi:hypothetical protein